MMTRSWILKRAFRLGRCVYRESRQKADAGLPHFARGATDIRRGLASAVRTWVTASIRGDTRAAFLGRWDLNVWTGCLAEAVLSRARRPHATGALP
jgi:hypothetical protein